MFIDSEPHLHADQSTIIVASGDGPDLKSVYVSLLQKQNIR